MARSILSALVPESQSKWARKAWTAAILLAPVAMALGIWLLVRTQPKPPVQVTIDRASAEKIARDFAAGQGIDTRGWNVLIESRSDDSSRKFANKSNARRDIWRYAPPLYARVTLSPGKEAKNTSVGVNLSDTAGLNIQIEQGQSAYARVNVALDGRVIGYDFTGLWRPGRKLPDREALRIARAQLPAGLSFGDPGITPTDTGREYSFHAAPMEDFDITANVRVEGARATKLDFSASPEEAPGSSDSDTQDVIVIIAIIFACAMAAFAIFRYAVRTMQGEISHARSALIGSLCAAFFLLMEGDIVHIATGTPSFVMWLTLGLFSVLAGGMLAIAYGSGEGDVREEWPGKLTSLDALLTGRPWSRNVGAAVLFGFACAGWCLFAVALLSMPFRHPDAIVAEKALIEPLIRFSFLIGFVTYPLIAITYAAAGLLQPLAFLSLYGKRWRRWWIPILAVCSGLAASVRVSDSGFTEFALITVILAAALIVPFFELDLLASLVCIGATIAGMNFAPALVSLPHEHSTAVRVLVVAGIVLFALLAVRYGKTIGEEQVRPLYARHIAERKSLEAEVSAAREAQLRLLPAGVPECNGLQISAACVPAEVVGGDFYDFFNLRDGRLGIFMAEGNNRGLAAALNIALAKGYLMQAVRKTDDPVELLARLESALASMLGKSTPGDTPLGNTSTRETGFAFATIDVRGGGLRYARTGDYPRLTIASSVTVVTETLAPVRGRSTPLLQGSAEIAAGDSILLFTDGIGRKLSASGRDDSGRMLAKMAADYDAATLSRRVLAASKYEDAPDDLTLVVIHVESVGESALEVVA